MGWEHYAGSDVDEDDFDDYVRLRQPFRRMFRLSNHAVRWGDAVANLANAFRVPRGSRQGLGTGRALLLLADAIAEDWQAGDTRPSRERARRLAHDAVYSLDLDDVRDVVADFEWGNLALRPRDRKKPITPNTYEFELRRLVIRQLAERTERVMRRAAAGERSSAA